MRWTLVRVRAAIVAAMCMLAAVPASAQTYVWNNPSGGFWFQSANWTPPGVPDQPGESAVLPDLGVAYKVIPASLVSVDDLHVGAGATLQVFSGTTFVIRHSVLHNDGVITVGPEVTTRLKFATDCTLEGSGAIVMIGEGIIEGDGGSTGTLTQKAGHTIRGSGTIRLPLVNQGTVDADTPTFSGLSLQESTSNSGVLRASPGATLRVEGSNSGVIEGTDGTVRLRTMTNAGGVIRANGGDLTLIGTLINTGGAIRAEGGNVTLNGSVTGGAIESDLDRTVWTEITTLTNVTIADDANVEILGPTSITGPATIDGTLTVSGTLTFQNDHVLEGAGTLRIQGGRIATAGSATLTVPADHMLTGFGTLEARLVNQGTLRAEGGVLQLRDMPKTNAGTIDIDPAGGTLVIAGGTTIQNAGGVIVPTRIEEGATIENGGGMVRAPGPVTVLGNNSGCTIRGGILDAVTGGGFTAIGAAHLDGVTLAPTATLKSVVAATIHVVGDGLVNQGTVRIATGSTIEVAPASSYVQTAGTTLLEGGTLVAPSGIDIQGGALRGVGTIQGMVTNAGELSPGTSPGTLAITGDYRQLADGTMTVELGGTGAGEFDRVEIMGVAELDGTLRAIVLGGYTPAEGDRLEIMTFDSFTAPFAHYEGFGVDPLVLIPEYGDDGDRLTIRVAVPGVLPVPEVGELPRRLRLYTPARDAALVLELPEAADAEVLIFDVGGRVVARVAEGAIPAGRHRFTLAGAAASTPSGVFFARAQVRTSAGMRELRSRIVVTR